jgi:hypothetical protein
MSVYIQQRFIYFAVKDNNVIVLNNTRYMFRPIRQSSGTSVRNSKPSEMR